ncbi:MAG TPA: DUF374 domain-containing protein [Candidatus Binatia bacterium]|nr:DUF374 domain-containing protein [Candidatus Binatia bacterium]
MASGRAGLAGRRPRVESTAFRRHWTWRTRAFVAVAGAAIALALRLVYLTLRVRLVDEPGVFAARARGQRVIGAFWHDAIPLVPLLKRFRWPGRGTIMLSWHRDAEIAARAVRWFGVDVVHGSSTRGWLGGLRGMLAAHEAGSDLLVVPDGPRGPRHVAKEGVVQLARATGLPVVPIGAAAAPRRRLRSWDRMQLPLPFARVALVVGRPVHVARDADAAALAAAHAAVGAALAEAAAAAAAAVGAPS